jgi:hypothetical protein
MRFNHGWMSDERLRAPRYEVSLMVVCDDGATVWSAPVGDMSESGVFLLTTETLAIGSKVKLIPEVEDDQQLPFELEAEVVRHRDLRLEALDAETAGIAFRLVGLTIPQFSQLRAFLRRRGKPKRGDTG